MKLITFKIPTLDGPREAQGYRVRLFVGNKREWFVLQMDDSKPAILAHWASGYKVANLRALALSRFVQTGYFSGSEGPAYWRKFAQAKLDSIPPEKVRAAIAAVPVLNL